MLLTSFGDMASTYRNSMNNAKLRAEIQRLTEELTTGRTRDLRAATGGDMGTLARIESGLAALDTYRTTNSEADTFVDAAQRSLATVQSVVSETSGKLLKTASIDDPTILQTVAGEAKAGLETIVSALNTRIADRSVFAGTATGTPPLASADSILGDLQVAIAGQSDAAGVIAAIDSWFAPGGAFETSGYLGDTTDLAQFRVSPNATVDFVTRADASEFREVLKAFAMAALLSEGVLSGQPEERRTLMSAAGEGMISADTALTDLRASIGTLQAQIDEAKTRNGAEEMALKTARGAIVSVDPFEAATALQSVQFQLESFYTITARTARLSLTEFLR